MTDPLKRLVVIGGPNGAGKTTAAVKVLGDRLALREFLNADEIARGLSPLNSDAVAFAAGRVMIERIRQLAQAGENFAFETTCSGVGHAKLIESCKSSGYHVTLLFLWLRSPNTAVARVANRVRHGGHGIPSDVIVRRYWSGLRNMRRLYFPLADVGQIYDNSDFERQLIAQSGPSGLVIHDHEKWSLIEEATA